MLGAGREGDSVREAFFGLLSALFVCVSVFMLHFSPCKYDGVRASTLNEELPTFYKQSTLCVLCRARKN